MKKIEMVLAGNTTDQQRWLYGKMPFPVGGADGSAARSGRIRAEGYYELAAALRLLATVPGIQSIAVRDYRIGILFTPTTAPKVVGLWENLKATLTQNRLQATRRQFALVESLEIVLTEDSDFDLRLSMYSWSSEKCPSYENVSIVRDRSRKEDWDSFELKHLRRFKLSAGQLASLLEFFDETRGIEGLTYLSVDHGHLHIRWCPLWLGTDIKLQVEAAWAAHLSPSFV